MTRDGSVLYADNPEFLLVLSVLPVGNEGHQEATELLPH